MRNWKRWRRLACLAAAALLSTCSLFDYSAIHSNRFALVYGISGYALNGPAGAPNLQYPDVDASDMRALLLQNGYTVLKSRWVDASGNVFVDGAPAGQVGTPTIDAATPPNITDNGSGSALAPSRPNIFADIQSLSALVGPNDTVVIYFSGHGMMDTITPPSTHQWIVPYGGVVYFPPALYPNDYGYAGYPGSSIRDNELGSLLADLPTRRVILFLDTCNSGGFIGDKLESDALPAEYKGLPPVVTPTLIAAAVADYTTAAASSTGISPYNATVIAAAGKDESSYESGPPFSHGIMTYFLLMAAASGDLNQDGAVTALESYAFIKAGIDQDWNSDAQIRAAGDTFAPHISGGPVDFVLF